MENEITKKIKELYKEYTTSGSPRLKTQLARSLFFLSMEIYTEEERFIYELLQNAVDAFSSENSELKIKIAVKNGFVVFMHNGSEFTVRDVVGICSVGSGNKTEDIKKLATKASDSSLYLCIPNM